MTEHEHQVDDETTQMWKGIMENGHRNYPYSLMPGNPKCRMCLIPLGGVGGTLMKAVKGLSASRKNPNLCNY
jgi:hypothetical protein